MKRIREAILNPGHSKPCKSKYSRLPSNDENETQIEMTPTAQKSSSSNESEFNRNLAGDKPLVINLNKPKRIEKSVTNPLYNVDEYLRDDKTKNSNNNNSNKSNSNRKTSCRNNSFLNILSRTIRQVMSQRSSRHESRSSISMVKNKLSKPKEIQIDLCDNNEKEVELKMKIPRHCFTNSDIEQLSGGELQQFTQFHFRL